MTSAPHKQNAPAQLALSEGGSEIHMAAGLAHECSGGAA